MNNKIAYVSLFAFALPIAACLDTSAVETSDDKATAEATSDLTGGPWTWVNAATTRCLDSNTHGGAYTLGCNGGDYQKWVNWPSTHGDNIIDVATSR